MVVGLLVPIVAAGGWYFGPWGREFRLAHADLLTLDREAGEDPNDWRAWYYFGERLRQKGSTVEAIAALRHAGALRPDDARVLASLGHALLDNRQVEPAFQVLKFAEARDSHSPEVQMQLARLYERRGAYHKAEPYLRAVLARHPDDADAWDTLGFCYLEMQQVQDASEAARRALKLRPHDEGTLRLNASIAAAQGKLEYARHCFEEGVRYHPDDPPAYSDLANFLLSQSRSREDARRAEEAVGQLERIAPGYPLLPWHRARIAALHQDWPTAIARLRETLAAAPTLDEAYFALANAYHRLGRTKEGDAAMATFRRRSDLARRMNELQIRLSVEESPQLHFELARLRRENGFLTQAREAAQEGLRLSPGNPAGLAELRRIDRAGGKQPPEGAE
jgi:tetratricopeptide (TPR) repeat protein